MVVIEMNPRVSRSSALASKATGFPIAKFAAKLAVGYSLDEIQNDITKKTPACFEPTIDYVVTKVPRFTFEKFKGADDTLTSSMKSVGEAMAIGQTFKESFQKALRSLETGAWGFGGGKLGGDDLPSEETINGKLVRPNAERVYYIRYALKAGYSLEKLFELTKIDPWFLHQLKQISDLEDELKQKDLDTIEKDLLKTAKEYGFSDRQLGGLFGCDWKAVNTKRKSVGINTVFRLVDTCAAEFEAETPYYYSSYGDESEIIPSNKKKILIIGGGPNRIGQGIEFDYCCVHASYALQELGYESVMINSNPETVSTDYDTSDKLYFEPLTLEDVLEVYNQEGCSGAIVQYGGQTPLNLATELKANGVNIIGTSPESIDAAEDRELFKQILDEVGLKQPDNKTALDEAEAYELADQVGFPLLVRPSFVLGGRGMFIVHDMEELRSVIREAFDASPGKPVLLDKFLEDAIELDVDCISDGTTSIIGGMLEHIEFAGVHSGDAAMVLPPHTLSAEMIEIVRQASFRLAKALKVIGLMNIQFAIQGDQLFVLEVNPRASRTVPFVSKAIGMPLAKIAAKVMTGKTLQELDFTEEMSPKHWCIKEAVFPFVRFPGSTIRLGPEMRSTGEVMGMDEDFGVAFAKTQAAAKPSLPVGGNVFLSVKDQDKPKAVELAKKLVKLGFQIYSTSGTADNLKENGIEANKLFRIAEGRPNVLDLIKNGEMQMIINTPSGMVPRKDENHIRSQAYLHNICIMTTLTGATAAVAGIEALKEKDFDVRSVQSYVRKNVATV
jgi:carbamoyl-phosphate synthase large subunit